MANSPTITAKITADDQASRVLEAVSKNARNAAASVNASQAAAARAAIAMQRDLVRAHEAHAAAIARSNAGLNQMLTTMKQLAAMKIGQIATSGLHEGTAQSAERVRMASAGISQPEIAALDAQTSALLPQILGMHKSAMMETARELHAILLDPMRDEAGLLPSVLKAQQLLNSSASAEHGRAGQSITPIVKALESMGLTLDPNKFATTVENLGKAFQVFGGGQLNADTYRAAVQTSGSASMFWNDEFRDKLLPALVNEFGDRSGTMLNQFGKEFAGNFNSSHGALKNLINLGLINKDQVEFLKTGEAKQLLPGQHIRGYELASQNPLEFVDKILKPALERNHITKPEDVQAIVNAIAPNKNVSAFISKALEQYYLWKKDESNIDSAKGFAGLNPDDATVALGYLEKALANFAGVVTSPIMRDAAHAMNSLSSGIGEAANAFSKFQTKNSELAEILAGGAVVGGGALGVGALAAARNFMFAPVVKAAADMSAAAARVAAGGEAVEVAAASLGAFSVSGVAAIAALGIAAGYVGKAAQLALGLDKPRVSADPNVPTLDTYVPGVNDSIYNGVGDNPTGVPSFTRHPWAGRQRPGYHPLEIPPWVNRDYDVNQSYAEQLDEHPIIHGERDMEAHRGRMLSRPPIAIPTRGPVQVQGNVNGAVEVEISQHHTFDFSNLANVIESYVTRATANIHGNLGESMTGSNSPRTPRAIGPGAHI